MLGPDRVFQIDLEERFYDFGYLVSTENDPDRLQQSVFDETIFLSTNDVSLGNVLLQGTSQVIGLEIKYTGTERPEKITSDLSSITTDNMRIRAKVFLGEDFNFNNGSTSRKIVLSQGTLTIKVNSNGSRSIGLNAEAGGLPLKGSWTGLLEQAELQF
jgi:hypothetical protein